MKFLVEELFEKFNIEKFPFPKYSTQFINLANQNAKWTVPAVVGQMSDLIHKCPERTIASRQDRYLENYGDRVAIATDKIRIKLQEMKEGYDAITKDIVKNRVYDLLINKTAEGLMIQEFIFKKLSEKYGKKYRLATPDEEKENIDGYLGDVPVQIKSVSFDTKKTTVRGTIDVLIVYYNKTDKFLYIDDVQLNNFLEK